MSEVPMSDFDDMEFDFDDDFDFGSSSSSSSSNKDSRASFFKELGKGFVVGGADQLGEYMPTVKETKESIAEMSETFRSQAEQINSQVQKIKPYMKGVKTDVSLIIKDIKNQKGLFKKIDSVNKGIDRIKKNIAYTIDPDTASSMNMSFDGDEDTSVYGYDEEGNLKSEKQQEISADTKSSNDINAQGYNAINRGLTGVVETLGLTAGETTEAIATSGANIQANQSNIFQRTQILLTQQHMEKMAVLKQLATNAVLHQKFQAEVLGPITKQNNQYFQKMSLQLTDLVNLMKIDTFSADKSARNARSGKGKFGIGDIVTSGGGIDFSKLYNRIVTNAKESELFQMADMVAGVKDMLPMLLGSGDNFSVGEQIGRFAGKWAAKPLKRHAQALNKKIESFVPTFLANLNQDAASGKFGSIGEFISDMVDIDNSSKASADVLTKNKRVGFDMITRKSIVEVIPGYLAKILSAVNGQEEMMYDHTRGTYASVSDMKARQKAMVDKAGLGAMYSSKRNIVDALKTMPGEESLTDNEIDGVMKSLLLSKTFFNEKSIREGKFSQEGLARSAFGKSKIDEKDKRKIAAFFKAYQSLNASDKASFTSELTRGKTSRTSELNNMSVDFLENGMSTILGENNRENSVLGLKRQLEDKKTEINNRLLKEEENRKKAEAEGKQYKGYYTKDSSIYAKDNLKVIDLEKEIANFQMQNNSIHGKVRSPTEKIYDLLLGGIYVYPKTLPEGEIPSHIKNLTAEGNAVKAAAQSIANAKKAAAEALKKAEAQEAEINYNNAKKMKDKSNLSLMDRLRSELGEGGVARRILGDTVASKGLSLMDAAAKTSIGSGMARLSTKINNTVGGTVNYLSNAADEYIATGDISRETIDKGKAAVTQALISSKNSIVGSADKILGVNSKASKALHATLDKIEANVREKGTMGAAKDYAKKAKAEVIKQMTNAQTWAGKKYDETTHSIINSQFGKKAAEIYKTTTSKVRETGNTIADKARQSIDIAMEEANKNPHLSSITNAATSGFTRVKGGVENAANFATSEIQEKGLLAGSAAVVATGIGEAVGGLKSGFAKISEKVNAVVTGGGVKDASNVDKSNYKPQSAQKAKEKNSAPEFTKKNKNKNMKLWASKDTQRLMKLDKQGKLGLTEKIQLWFTIGSEKFNYAMFGNSKKSDKLGKDGLVGKISENSKKIFDKLKDKLLGDKKKAGILKKAFHKLISPFLPILENFRHKIIKKFFIPIVNFGKSLPGLMKSKALSLFRGIKSFFKKRNDKKAIKQTNRFKTGLAALTPWGMVHNAVRAIHDNRGVDVKRENYNRTSKRDEDREIIAINNDDSLTPEQKKAKIEEIRKKYNDARETAKKGFDKEAEDMMKKVNAEKDSKISNLDTLIANAKNDKQKEKYEKKKAALTAKYSRKINHNLTKGRSYNLIDGTARAATGLARGAVGLTAGTLGVGAGFIGGFADRGYKNSLDQQVMAGVITAEERDRLLKEYNESKANEDARHSKFISDHYDKEAEFSKNATLSYEDYEKAKANELKHFNSDKTLSYVAMQDQDKQLKAARKNIKHKLKAGKTVTLEDQINALPPDERPAFVKKHWNELTPEEKKKFKNIKKGAPAPSEVKEETEKGPGLIERLKNVWKGEGNPEVNAKDTPDTAVANNTEKLLNEDIKQTEIASNTNSIINKIYDKLFKREGNGGRKPKNAETTPSSTPDQLVEEARRIADNESKGGKKHGQKRNSKTSTIGATTKKGSRRRVNRKRNKQVRKVGDAIVKPDGTIIETAPDDTIVALADVEGALTSLQEVASDKVREKADAAINESSNPFETSWLDSWRKINKFTTTKSLASRWSKKINDLIGTANKLRNAAPESTEYAEAVKKVAGAKMGLVNELVRNGATYGAATDFVKNHLHMPNEAAAKAKEFLDNINPLNKLAALKDNITDKFNHAKSIVKGVGALASHPLATLKGLNPFAKNSHIDTETNAVNGSVEDQRREKSKGLLSLFQKKQAKGIEGMNDKWSKFVSKKGPMTQAVGYLKKIAKATAGGGLLGGLADGKGGKWDKLLTVLGGLGLAAGGGLTIAGLTNWFNKKKNRTKQDGIEGALTNEGNTKFRADGTKKGGLEQAFDKLDPGTLARSAVMGKNAIAKSATRVAKRARLDKAAAGADKVVTLLGNALKTAFDKVLKDSKIVKALGNKIGPVTSFLNGVKKRIVDGIGKKVGDMATKAASTMKNIANLISGPWGLIAFAVTDFIKGLGNAARWFGVNGKDVTLGMRLSSGVIEMVKGLVTNLIAKIPGLGWAVSLVVAMIPDDWLVQSVYKIFADEKQQKHLEEAQAKMEEKASKLGIDKDKLNEIENKSMGKTAWMGVKAFFNPNKSYKDYAEADTEDKLKKAGVDPARIQQYMADARSEGDSKKFAKEKDTYAGGAGRLDITSAQAKTSAQFGDNEAQDAQKIYNGLGNGPFESPVPFKAITSSFGHRADPTGNAGTNHGGIDFRATSGTKVVSMSKGVITNLNDPFQNPDPIFGGQVSIYDPRTGITTLYAHLKELDPSLAAGVQVGKGQFIGLSGGAAGDPGAGTSAGQHLHLSMAKDGMLLDPAEVIRNKGHVFTDTSVTNGTHYNSYPRAMTRPALGDPANFKPEEIPKNRNNKEMGGGTDAPLENEYVPAKTDMRSKVAGALSKMGKMQKSSPSIADLTDPFKEFIHSSTEKMKKIREAKVNFEPLMKHDSEVADVLHKDLQVIAQALATLLSVVQSNASDKNNPINGSDAIKKIMNLSNAGNGVPSSLYDSINNMAVQNAYGGT